MWRVTWRVTWYARHVGDHKILLVTEIASAPALANCRANSPSLPIPNISYMEDLWSSHNLATAYPYLLISSYYSQPCTPPAHCVPTAKYFSLLHLTHQPFQLLAALHPASSSLSAYRPAAAHCTISGWLSQNACQLLAIVLLPLPVVGHCICIIAPTSCWPLHLHHLSHYYSCTNIGASCWSFHIITQPVGHCIIIPASHWLLAFESSLHQLWASSICVLTPASSIASSFASQQPRHCTISGQPPAFYIAPV